MIVHVVDTGPTLIVFESNGTWAAALRRLGLPAPLRMREVRTSGECRENLALSPNAIVTIAATQSNLAAVVDLLVELTDRHTGSTLMVLAERSLLPMELLFREAGAIHVVFSPRQLRHVVESAARYTSHFPVEAGAADEVWERLPWRP